MQNQTLTKNVCFPDLTKLIFRCIQTIFWHLKNYFENEKFVNFDDFLIVMVHFCSVENILLWFEGPRWNWNIEWTLNFTNILSLNLSCCNAFMVPSMNIIRINLIGSFIFLYNSVLSSDITCSVETVGDNCHQWSGKEYCL